VVVTVQQLAAALDGKVCGDGAREVRDARSLREAGPEHVTFLEGTGAARHLTTCKAGAILTSPALRAKHSAKAPGFTFIEVADPLAAFVVVMRQFRGTPKPPPPGVAAQAAIHPTARVGADATIDPFAVIGEGTVLGARCRIGAGTVVGRNCRLGDDVTLHPRVVLYDGVLVGNRVEIHAGAVIGADGFGYRTQDGRHVKVPQFGAVEIGDDVDIGAGTTIDAGTFHNTRIGAGTKIDNAVQIGHNCQIGRHNLFVSQVGIAGSSSTGDYVVLAGQVGVKDNVHIGDGVLVGGKSGVYGDVPAGERWLGNPARPEREHKRILVCLERLPQLLRDIRELRMNLGLKDGAGRDSA
jgi:UDP-3-O-[3-hydroxymyristoyl] glucosamine N-acyltransferase